MSVFGNLEIGKTGLRAAQLGQTTSGHNISNANTAGYSRQRVDQSADANLDDGLPNGVRVDGISRYHDKFNSEKLTLETSNLADWSTRLNFMRSVENIFQDLEGRGVLEALTEFWNAWSSAANQPESIAERQGLITASNQLSEQISKLDQQLLEVKGMLNQDLSQSLSEVNKLAEEVASLNKQIHRIEALRGDANDLKDQRDEAIRKIAEQVDVNWFYNKQNMIDVQLSAGVPLVRSTSAYDLVSYYDTADTGFPVVGYNLDKGNLLNVSDQINGGRIKGIINTRDVFIEAQRSKISQLASTLSDQVNSLHAAGSGIGPPPASQVSAFKLAPEQLTQPITNLFDGEFSIKLLPPNDASPPLSLTINVEAGIDSIDSLVQKINQSAADLASRLAAPEVADRNLGASPENESPAMASGAELLIAEVDPQGQLSLKAQSGYGIIFDQDSSGALARLGFNSFFLFDQQSSQFKINPQILADPYQIALGYDRNPGDNRIALAVHDLQFEKLLEDKTVTIDQFYRGIHSGVGLATSQAEQNHSNHQNMFDQYLALRDQVSGVNLDEEMTQMIKYQKAYDASAKYISTIDKMTETLINM